MHTDTPQNVSGPTHSLLELLDVQGVSRADLARRCGLRRGTIYLALNGHKPNIRGLLAIIAEGLDVKPSIVYAAIAESQRRGASAGNPNLPLVDPEHLAELRAVQQMSQAALAKKARIAEMTISAIENGTKPHSATLHAIAKGLSMDYRYVALACGYTRLEVQS